MALRYPGAPPQVRSGLLGKYSPDLKQSIQNRRGGGGGLDFGGGGGGGFQAPEMSELSKKYLTDMPSVDIKTDPGELYEGMAGGYRSDVQGAMTEAGQRAISQAATSGREVSDVMARYLPEAVKGFGRGAADIAGTAAQLGSQAEIAKSDLELRRQGMANEMARFDSSQQQQQFQFMKQLETEYQMHREQMSNNLRIAQTQAGSNAERQAIGNAHTIQMQKMQQQFSMKAQQFGEVQKNARHAQSLSLQDKHFGAEASRLNRQQMIQGVETVGRYRDPFSPTGPGVQTGPDQGTSQYRSARTFQSPEQRTKDDLFAKMWSRSNPGQSPWMPETPAPAGRAPVSGAATTQGPATLGNWTWQDGRMVRTR